MKNRKWIRIAAAMLCMLMLGSLFGCSQNPSRPESPDGPGSDASHNADYHLTPDSTLRVHDGEGNGYAGYILHLSREGNQFERTYQVATADPFPLSLPKGMYTFTVTVPEGPTVCSFTVYVSSKGTQDQIDLVISPEQPQTAVPEAQTRDALNALLVGVTLNPRGETAAWTEGDVYHVIYRKLLWDPSQYSDDGWLSGMGLYGQSGDCSFDAELVRQLTRDTLGRELAEGDHFNALVLSGDRVLLEPATGESTTLTVQHYTRQGTRVTATGTVVQHYSAYSEFVGYFEAVFEENPSSVYGYTLVSIDGIDANQRFDNLIASASSELIYPGYSYAPEMAIDGDRTTAWVEGVDGLGIGEWIMLYTPDGIPMDIAVVEFALGYQKSDDLLFKNGWPYRLLIECSDGHRQEVELFSYDDAVILDHPVSGGWIRFTILEAQAGSKYEDVCISEIRLHGLSGS